MLSIEPRGRRSAEEELGAVGSRARVGHRKDSSASVLERKVLVLEPCSVYGCPTSPVTVGKVAALAHEARDNTMERGVGEWRWRIIAAIYDEGGCAELAEILGSLRNDIGAESHLNSSGGFSTNRNVKENNRVTHYII